MRFSSQYIFLVHSSSWQLLMVKEYIYQKKLKDSDYKILVFVKSLSSSLEQLKKLSESLNLKIRIFEYEDTYIGKIRRYWKILKINISCEKLMFSQLNVRWMDFLIGKARFKNLGMYDEGTHSIEVLRKVEKQTLGKKLDEFFTQYTDHSKLMSDVKVEKNNLNFLNSRMNLNNLKDVVWFVGQPLYKEDVTESIQIAYIDKVIKSKKNVVYIPHRYENDLFLEKVKSLGVSLLYSDTLIELLPISENYLPKNIIGFTTSSLINFKKVLPESVIVEFVRVEDQDLLPKRKDRMNLFYSKIKEAGITQWSASE